MRKMPFSRGMLQHALSHSIPSFFCCIVVLFLLTLVASERASASEPILESVGVEYNSIPKVGQCCFGQLGNSTNNSSNNMAIVTKNFDAVLAFTTDSVALGENAVVSLSDPESDTSGSTVNLVNVSIKSTTDSSGTTLRLTETGASTGSFLGTIGVSSKSTLVNSNIKATVGDTLTVTFTDNPDANGGISIVTDTAIVTAAVTAQPPSVVTGSSTNVTFHSATLNGTVNANELTTTAWFQYGTTIGYYDNTSSTQGVSGSSDTTVSINIGGLLTGTSYYYRLVAENSAGTTYGSEMSFITTTDTTKPSGSIGINSNAAYTNSTTVTLTLSATDDVGVTGYYISTSSTAPAVSDSGWTVITSSTSYTENVSYTISSGDGSKTIYVWYKDAYGNVSSSSDDSIILDTTSPTIIITSPTSSSTYTSESNVINLEGVAFDNTSGISSVIWTNNIGENGTTTGTTNWSISDISLSNGDNVITVTAQDGAENTSTDTITVVYTLPIPTPTPTSSPIPTLTPSPIETPNEKGSISGDVVNARGYPIESAKIRLKGVNSKVLKKTVSDEDGLFEFVDLDVDTYIITVLKNGYKKSKQTVILEEGEETDIEIMLKKSSKL